MKSIFIKADLLLAQRSSEQVRLFSLLLIGLIALIDVATGYEINVSIFYLIPVAITAWYCNHRSGIIFSVLSAIAWFLVDITERPYVSFFAPYWNSSVRLGFFLIAEGLLNQLKVHLDTEKKLSRIDPLTGLLNVRGFIEQAEQLFGLATRHKRPVALAYIDLDNFKKVNDEHGHSEGDKVLQIVGDKIKTSLRITDSAGRLGGDEFAIVLPETDEAGAKAMLDSLRGALLQETQIHNWPISFSIGVVSFDSPSSNLNEAIKIADSLMYQVKAHGKNNVMFQHFPAI